VYSSNPSALDPARSGPARAPFHRSPRTSIGRLLTALLAVAGIASCGGVDDGTPSGAVDIQPIEWQVVFQDDFNGDSLDLAKWNIDEGDGCPDLCGWGNNEDQIYSADNITVANGILAIEGRQESDGTYTSARINTKGKFDFRYGRVEVKAKLPGGQGAWPAIWMLNSDEVYGPWPTSGEIDIVEGFNLGVNGNQKTQSTAHYGLPTPPYTGTSSQYDSGSSPTDGFVEYALEWERDKLRFYVDGVHFQTQNAQNWYAYYPADEDEAYNEYGAYRLGRRDSPFDQLFHLIINFAIGGDAVGAPSAGAFPQTMEVDYVRVYECANANPDTGRGCGVADASVVPLKDNDGGPLQDVETAQPYREELVVYTDSPETIELEVGGVVYTNTLSVDGFTGEGATVINDPLLPDPDDAENTVWHFAVSGGVANGYLKSQDLTDDPILDTGFNFSGNRKGGLGGDPVGEVAFDMQVNSIDPGARILIKLDSGFPNLGEVVLPAEEILVGGWKTYSVKFDELLANPGFVECCGGTGVDLKNVINPFVIEIQDGAADVYLDNIRVTNACKVVGACGADLRTKGIPDVIVFDDAVNRDLWPQGIRGSSSDSGWTDYTDGNTDFTVNWNIVASDDPERGNVIEVFFKDNAIPGVWFISNQGGIDLSAYSAGAVVFDIKVFDYGPNEQGMNFKIDTKFPDGSGDRNIGKVGDGEWETYTFPVSQLATNESFNLAVVTTGIVIWPPAHVGGVRYQLDNIRWVAETDVEPPPVELEPIDLPVTFDDPNVDYTLSDFGDGNDASTVLTDDPTGVANTVAATTKPVGAPFWAGTVVGKNFGGFANPIPFTPEETVLSMRVYSPAAGIPVRLKVENIDNDQLFAEMDVVTTVANAWEPLNFDFSTVGIDTSIEYSKAVVFFDFVDGKFGDGSTYYWDDLEFGRQLAQIDLPVTFDDPNVDYTLSDFGDAITASTVLADDPTGAVNTVAATTKTAGAPFWAGTVIGKNFGGFANPIPFTASETTLSVWVYSPAAGITVRLKVENGADGNLFAEMDAVTAAANAWELLVFDFSTVGIDTSIEYNKAVIFFDFVDGKLGDGSTYYWDELQFGVPAP
jgi:beta-glucanase (GH16 family)